MKEEEGRGRRGTEEQREEEKEGEEEEEAAAAGRGVVPRAKDEGRFVLIWGSPKLLLIEGP